MRLTFRQGVVSHQTGGFLYLNLNGNVDLAASNRPTVVTVAHGNVDYLWSEDASIEDAWVGPFSPSVYYWLYWDFNSLTFERSFGYTTLEPVYQPVAPGYNIPSIVGVIPGTGGSPDANGAFTIAGYFIFPAGRPFEVRTSTGNDGIYTTVESVYDTNLGRTTIYVEEAVPDTTVDGNLYLEFDTFGETLAQTGRHWFNTSTNRLYVYTGSTWAERIRVFAARLHNLTFSPLGVYTPPNFTGTQVGIMNTTRRAGRVMFTDSTIPIKRDDGIFITTEDQLFANASRVDALRLESNVARAEASMNLAAFQVVGWTAEGVISSANYDMVGRGDPGDPLPPDDETTVLGILCEPLLTGETGAVIIQGVVTNPDWNWLNVTRVGGPLWVSDNGTLVPQDPHFTDAVTYPIGRVPVARVLARDTIVFEQGLGGKGDRGSGGGGTFSFDVENIGNGAGIHAQTVNDIAQLKSLVAGDNITITSSATEITISTTPLTSLPYDIAFFVSGTPTDASVTLGSFVAVRSVFVSSTALHRAVADTGPAAQTVYPIYQNNTQVGSVTFAAGQTTGSVSFNADITLLAGQLLRLVAPASPDTTISDVAVIIDGCASIVSECADLPGAPLTLPYDMSFFVPGTPDTGDLILGMFVVSRTVFISSASTTHEAVAEVAPSAQTVYSIQEGATSVGTVTFEAGQTIGSVVLSGDVTLSPGDVLKLISPASPDLGISDVAVTISGCVDAAANCSLS